MSKHKIMVLVVVTLVVVVATHEVVEETQEGVEEAVEEDVVVPVAVWVMLRTPIWPLSLLNNWQLLCQLLWNK